MRLLPLLTLPLLALAACASPASETERGDESALTEQAATFEACGSESGTLYSADGRHIASITCATGTKKPIVRIHDVASGTSKDIAWAPDPLQLIDTGDGKHFHVLDYTHTLHVYSWDGGPEKTFPDVGGYAFSQDGKRVLTYVESHSAIGLNNRFRLDARVRELDGPLDVSARYEESRGSNFVNGDASVTHVMFAPDGSHVAFLRRHVTSVVDHLFTNLDIATGKIADGKSLGWAEAVYPDTYDGEGIAYIQAGPDGQRRFRFASATPGKDHSALLLNQDPNAYAGDFCATKAGPGYVFFSQPTGPYDAPASLSMWSAASGVQRLFELPKGVVPPKCPRSAGELVWFERGSEISVLPLAAGAKSVEVPRPDSPIYTASGKRLAVVEDKNLTIVDAATGTTSKLTLDAPGVRLSPEVAFDGDRVLAVGVRTRTEGGKSFVARSVWSAQGTSPFQPITDLGENEGSSPQAAFHPLASDRLAIESLIGAGHVRVTILGH